MHGMSGASKTGKIHYYYSCKNHRKHKCSLRNIPQLQLEAHAMWVLSSLLENSENLVSLAVDVATYYKELNADNGYIGGLEAELKETEKGINNLIKAIEKGALSETVSSIKIFLLQPLPEKSDKRLGNDDRKPMSLAHGLLCSIFETVSSWTC